MLGIHYVCEVRSGKKLVHKPHTHTHINMHTHINTLTTCTYTVLILIHLTQTHIYTCTLIYTHMPPHTHMHPTHRCTHTCTHYRIAHVNEHSLQWSLTNHKDSILPPYVWTHANLYTPHHITSHKPHNQFK